MSQHQHPPAPKSPSLPPLPPHGSPSLPPHGSPSLLPHGSLSRPRPGRSLPRLAPRGRQQPGLPLPRQPPLMSLPLALRSIRQAPQARAQVPLCLQPLLFPAARLRCLLPVPPARPARPVRPVRLLPHPLRLAPLQPLAREVTTAQVPPLIWSTPSRL
ncbi:hypothetical protein V565_003370 [Rhizoctonia solani 123E]|uniref:Uncharacterized protein n=1 Tax=Rhizoctonia solani 123E TaxID=1423351 RepID=A0A074SFI3_9AGAM|nr:hypothetical protein V565_003370 [Rhizoctonia solani 123E]